MGMEVANQMQFLWNKNGNAKLIFQFLATLL